MGRRSSCCPWGVVRQHHSLPSHAWLYRSSISSPTLRDDRPVRLRVYIAHSSRPIDSPFQHLASGIKSASARRDQNSPAATLSALSTEQFHYVTALKPSHHRAWLAEVAGALQPVLLRNAECIQALKTRRLVHEVEQTVVVLRSETLYEGQRRGLEQSLTRAMRQLERLSARPRAGLDGARKRVGKILDRQDVRQILHCDVTEHDGRVVVQPSIDLEARQRIETQYFGLRILATNQHEWRSEQIIEAYRGQARVERAFRDLKDPWICAFRPQYHWTDQKLVVHAFIAVMALLLGRVLLRRAQKAAGFRGTLRSLLHRLARLRLVTIVEQRPGASGRPRLRRQYEQCDAQLRALTQALGMDVP
jgi:hypothetical protein